MLRSSVARSYVGFITEEDLLTYVQARNAISLQKISNVLQDENCWAFSIAFDADINQGNSFIDVRCRFFNGSIQNVHFLEIPLRGIFCFQSTRVRICSISFVDSSKPKLVEVGLI